MKPGFSSSVDRCDSFVSADEQLHEVPISPVSEGGDMAPTPDHKKTPEDSPKRGRIDSANIPAEYRSFFSTRPGTIQSAITRCSDILLPSDGKFHNVWLLTLIHHWDAETERIVMLTEHSLLIVKYDFIRLHAIHVRRVPLSLPDCITIGDLTYPPLSLAPRLSGLACGVASVIHGCMVDGVMSTFSQLRMAATGHEDSPVPAQSGAGANETTTTSSAISTNSYRSAFQPRYRRVAGVQVSWGSADKIHKWNPLARDLPTITLCSHPLFWCEQGFNESDRFLFNVESFSSELSRLVGQQVSRSRPTSTHPTGCVVQHKDIVVENYVGLLSVLFNTAQMGFFKERGRISF